MSGLFNSSPDAHAVETKGDEKSEPKKNTNDAAKLEAVIKEVEAMAEKELAKGYLPGFSIAIIDDQDTIFAKGYGLANREGSIPATEKTIYRAGSISKLLNATMVMTFVEEQKLDLDKPVTEYIPSFNIVNPHKDQTPITLRQLMCHRAGMVRESPVGHYLDDSNPGIEATVLSLAECVMPFPPNRATKYSNSGVTVSGHAAEKVSGKPYNDIVTERVLKPLGMNHSSFEFDDKVKNEMSMGYMHIADGKGGLKYEPAPNFRLGTIPAGNLFTSVEDLAKYVSFVLAKGVSRNGTQVLQEKTIEDMLNPELNGKGALFGIAFREYPINGVKTYGHGGAVYGFSTSARIVPEAKVGVIMFTNEDNASSRVVRLVDRTVELLLEAKLGKTPTPLPGEPIEMSAKELEEFAGEYESNSFWGSLKMADGQLRGSFSGYEVEISPLEKDVLIADGLVANGDRLKFTRDENGKVTGFSAFGYTFHRVDPEKVKPIPNSWKKYLGSYGPDFIPVVISERNGHLYAMTEDVADYILTPMNQTVFKLPAGMYNDEELIFHLDQDGNVHGLTLANMYFKRNADK